MPTHTRWKSLTLNRTLNELAGGDFISRYGTPTFPALEELNVSPSGYNRMLFGAIQQHAPQLHALSLLHEESFVFWEGGDPSVWTRLTYLEVASYSQRSILAVLQQCNQLETLAVWEAGFSDRVGQRIAPIELKSLRKLQIPIEGDREDAGWFLATYLILPNLTYLAIHRIEIWDTLDTVVEMVQRSGCTLRTVELNIVSPEDVSIGRLLRMATQASRLIIRGPVFSWLFDQMASNSGSPLVPNLEHLSVLFSRIPGPSRSYCFRPLGAILKAAKSLPRLQTLHIECFSEASDVDRISALEDLDVSTCIVKENLVDRVGQLRSLSGYLIFVHRHPESYNDNAPVFEEIFQILENDPNLTKEEFQASGLEERMKEISLKSFAEGFQFKSRAERFLARWS
ncbi:hypothetical protein WG66_008950 [Moniliophthora roreri]|uniref:F-box domain-containing protein n=1 Tax=Moniliophthora roreri TaxID=221103 RepID=A0A0W0F4T5_MONRR|nr:hypothetical protein WG66_008950 [Moniliophthora roreri]